jgi:hypothetical protein
LAPEISGAGDFKQPWQWMLDKPNHHALLGQLELTPAQKVAADKILEAKQAADQPWTYDSLAALAQIRAQVLTPDQTAQLARLEAEPPPKFVPRLIDWTRANRLLPEAYLYGYAHVWRQSFSTNNFAFLNGEVSLVGWRSFFPYVFLVKTPLALFGVALVALAAVGRQRKFAGSRPNHVSWSSVWHSSYSTIPLVVFFVIYWAAAISSHINIGHRHLLPVYPMIFILCGAAGRWFDQDECAAAMRPSLRRRMQLALVALIGVLAVEVTVYYPNYLAYFNGLVRPSQAYRHLVDSSLDWGQELPAVAQYLRAHRSGPAYFSYFGVGRPSYYGVEARIIGGFPGFDWKSAQHPFFFVPDDQAHRLPEFLRTHPDFDPNAFFRANTGQGPGRLLIIRPAALRLTGGTYLISATALQPMYYRGGLTWSTFHEAAYQRLRSRVQPWLSDDYAAKNAAMATASVDEWNTTFDAYLDYRFARLTAFLRKREPDDEINFSILVYRLTDRDLAQALDGASP